MVDRKKAPQPRPQEEPESGPIGDEDEDDPPEEILGGGSTLLKGETTEDSSEQQEAQQRDQEPDDYDMDTNVKDDRVRGAGEQSLEELTINQGRGLGLEEHIGGLRHDRPEPNVNDPSPPASEDT